MKLRKAVAVALVTLFALPWMSWAGSISTQDFLMFAGDTDSTTQLTAWIPIKNATRVRIRTWSTHLVGGANADTGKVDSIASFIVQFSDSICCYVTGPGGNTIASAQDSVQLTEQTFGVDTVRTMLGIAGAPINKALRGAVNGSGLITVIFPVLPASLAASSSIISDQEGVIGKQLMRVLFVPKRRNTSAGSASTQGLRTNGLRGIKMVATVQYANR